MLNFIFSYLALIKFNFYEQVVFPTLQILHSEARKQNTIKFVTYIAEQAHELQNSFVQMWGRKKLSKLQSFLDLFMCIFITFVTVEQKLCTLIGPSV